MLYTFYAGSTKINIKSESGISVISINVIIMNFADFFVHLNLATTSRSLVAMGQKT